MIKNENIASFKIENTDKKYTISKLKEYDKKKFQQSATKHANHDSYKLGYIPVSTAG